MGVKYLQEWEYVSGLKKELKEKYLDIVDIV